MAGSHVNENALCVQYTSVKQPASEVLEIRREEENWKRAQDSLFPLPFLAHTKQVGFEVVFVIATLLKINLTWKERKNIQSQK